MKKIFYTFLIVALGFISTDAIAKKSFGIAATVNKDAISEADVDERIDLIFASSGVRTTKENLQRARPQALNSLIEEQLKIQEAARQNLAVTDEEVEEGFSVMAQQNSMTAEQFEVVIGQQGIAKSTILRKVKAQIAWRSIIKNVLRPQIDVTETDVQARLDRLRGNIGKEEYNAIEIFLPVMNEQEDIETKELAERLISEIKVKNVQFSVVAAQFSKSSSGPQGGFIGWVQEGQLPQELDIVLKSLNVNQISPPIKSLSGYYILTVTEKRTVAEETLPSEEDVLNAIGLERLDRLQQRYLSDVRSAAFIDRRGE